MKKMILILLLLAAFALTACSTSISATATPSLDTSTAGLPIQTQLLIGSLKLDDTDQAITSTQAADLLPLWQVYQELLTSDTAAQEEKDALVNQIQETMTAEQLQAINSMNLTQEDLAVAVQEQGVISGTVQSDAGTTTVSVSQNIPGGDLPAGDMPAGDMPAGDMGMGQAQDTTAVSNSNASQVQTVEAFPTALIDTLVELLESKVV